MGKISDVLEKTTNNEAVTLPETHRVRAIGAKEKTKKVIPIEHLPAYELKNDLDKKLVTYYQPQSIEAEVFKILRTNVLFPASGKAPRTIMITSALPGEGKSFVSANLAISIARGIEEHVLLMDCDMRNSTIHKMFGFAEIPGLSDYLSRGVDLQKLLRKTPINKLTILAGGKPPHNPTELLSSVQMANLVEEVKSRYEDRYIIIDTPPPSLTAETNALARIVDGIIIVIKSEITNQDIIEEMMENIGKEKVLGVVLNSYQHGLKKYKGYGKYYGKK